MRSAECAAGDGDRTLVVLAYYYPPLAGVASDRAAAFRRHLPSLGWKPVIVTARNGFYHREPQAAHDDQHVIRARNPELSRLLRRIYGGGKAVNEPVVTPAGSGMLAARVRRLARDWLYVPDAQLGWIPFAAQAARRALTDERRSVLYSTSVPFSAHLAALAAARQSDRPWIAEFRDPWATSTSPMRSTSDRRKELDTRLERIVLDHADHVVVTSHTTRDELLSVHPKLPPARISVITNGFEPVDEGSPPPPGAPMTILYAGTVAAGEDVKPLLADIDTVVARHPGRIRLRVLGPPQPWRDRADRPWLELDGVVSPAEARQAMPRSSALLLIQAHPAYRAIIPGKLFEYVGARRPIVAVCHPGTELEEVVTRHADARIVRRDDAGSVARVVEQLLEEHEAGTLQSPRVPASLTAPLSREAQFRRLAEILNRLVPT